MLRPILKKKFMKIFFSLALNNKKVKWLRKIYSLKKVGL